MSDGSAEFALAPMEFDQAAKALSDRLGDLVMAADGGKQVPRGRRLSLAIWSHWPARVMAFSLRPRSPRPWTSKARRVGRRRAVEGRAIAHPVEQLCDRLVVPAGDHEAAARDLEALRGCDHARPTRP